MMMKRIAGLFIPLVLLTFACTTLKQIPNMPGGAGVTPSPSLTITVTITLTPEELTPTPSVTPTLAATSASDCPKAPPTRLKVGVKGRVTDTEGPPTRLRRTPELTGDILKLLPNGTRFDIIDGPVCVVASATGQAMMFWQVRITGEAVKGWVAEGDAEGYFIEPIP